MMWRTSVLLAAVATRFFPMVGGSQSILTAEIRGTIHDAARRAVASAVSGLRTWLPTGVGRTVISQRDGTFVSPALTAGRYRLEVAKPGFATHVQTVILPQASGAPTVVVATIALSPFRCKWKTTQPW